MPVENNIYNQRFFKNTIKLEAASAAAFVAVLLKYYQPRSVVDIGCGAGLYLREFERQGITDLLGIDGAPAARDEFLLDQKYLEIFDLAQPYNFARAFDLALCLEVAEHLRPEDADNLVSTICLASDNIVFTAAVPGQGPRSLGHINEQPPEYWQKKFFEQNFQCQKSQTEQMRLELDAQGVVWWLVNNLMIFSKI